MLHLMLLDECFCVILALPCTLSNKGTKAVTGAVPFQKVHVCT